ncbi:alpha/beta fold hydrolase [Pararobbsia alpina]|nr:alpha/beta hydrolase [Pararobbsia alpina]
MRPTLVLIPGWLCDSVVWAEQVRALEPFAHSVIADHGHRDSLEAMATAVLAMDLPERFSVAGHSMGGRVALEIVRQAPERVDRLALLDTGFQARPSDESGERERSLRMTLLQLARRSGMRQMGVEWSRLMIGDNASPALKEAVLDMVERRSVEQCEAQVRALLNRPDATSLLRSIKCPLLLACGREDHWSPLACHEEMRDLVKGSRLEIIEGSGHMTTMERPEAVSSILREWLQWSNHSGVAPEDSERGAP